MVIRKIDIVNVQLVKDNFTSRKYYPNYKFATCKIILHLVKRNSQLVNLFS